MDMEEKISFVQRQTNLEREEIRRLLEVNDGDYIQVVRDQYIKKKDDQKEKPIQSVNQEIYKQLRFEMSQLQKMLDKTKKK
jgi:preprotein translocase subunit SecA